MIRKENQDDLMKSRVMHNLPGRLRMEADGLKYLKEESGEIAAELARIPGVRLARVTACTGSVLLQYDHNVVDALELTEQIDMVLARHAMAALRARHAQTGEEPAEAPMTTARSRTSPHWTHWPALPCRRRWRRARGKGCAATDGPTPIF